MKDSRIAEQSSLLIESVDGCEIKLDIYLNEATTKQISASELVDMLKDFFAKEFGQHPKKVSKNISVQQQKNPIKTREDYVDSKFGVFYDDIRMYEQ